MSENYQMALMLMAVGMFTVSVILWVVVLVGNGIILFVNRYMPEVEGNAKVIAGGFGSADSSKIAAISAAVKIVTQGKGQVVKIEKK
jgi:oxaloacetate decarboxylase gamma subunit